MNVAGGNGCGPILVVRTVMNAPFTTCPQQTVFKKLWLLLPVLLALAMLNACNGAGSGAIVGRWEYVRMELGAADEVPTSKDLAQIMGLETMLTGSALLFRKSGIVEARVADSTAPFLPKGTYRVEEGAYLITEVENTAGVTEISKNRIETLTNDTLKLNAGSGTVIVFARVEE